MDGWMILKPPSYLLYIGIIHRFMNIPQSSELLVHVVVMARLGVNEASSMIMIMIFCLNRMHLLKTETCVCAAVPKSELLMSRLSHHPRIDI